MIILTSSPIAKYNNNRITTIRRNNNYDNNNNNKARTNNTLAIVFGIFALLNFISVSFFYFSIKSSKHHTSNSSSKKTKIGNNNGEDGSSTTTTTAFVLTIQSDTYHNIRKAYSKFLKHQSKLYLHNSNTVQPIIIDTRSNDEKTFNIYDLIKDNDNDDNNSAAAAVTDTIVIETTATTNKNSNDNVCKNGIEMYSILDCINQVILPKFDIIRQDDNNHSANNTAVVTIRANDYKYLNQQDLFEFSLNAHISVSKGGSCINNNNNNNIGTCATSGIFRIGPKIYNGMEWANNDQTVTKIKKFNSNTFISTAGFLLNAREFHDDDHSAGNDLDASATNLPQKSQSLISIRPEINIYDEKRNIVIFSHYLQMDGAPRLIATIAEYLNKDERNNVIVVSPMDGPLGDTLRNVGIQVIIDITLGDWNINDISSTIQRTKPHLVIFNTILWIKAFEKLDLNILNLPYKPKFVMMTHEHEITYRTRLPNNFWWGDMFTTLQTDDGMNKFSNKIDHIIFVSDRTRSLWSKYDYGHFLTFRGFVSIAETIQRCNINNNNNDHNNIFTNTEYLNYKDITQVQTKIQKYVQKENNVMKKSYYTITATGTYCPRKQQRLLVEAIPYLNKYHDVRLKLLGKPLQYLDNEESYYAKDIEERVQEIQHGDKIELVPFSPNSLQYIINADLHVSVSTHESFPLNTLEAMILGTPIALTTAGGSEEQIMNVGHDGFILYNITNEQELANQLVKIFNLGKQKLFDIGANGQYTAISHFSDYSAGIRITNLQKELFHATGGKQQFQEEKEEVSSSIAFVINLDDIITNNNELIELKNILKSLSTTTDKFQKWKCFLYTNGNSTTTQHVDNNSIYSFLSELDDYRMHILEYDMKDDNSKFNFIRNLQKHIPVGYDWILILHPSTNDNNRYYLSGNDNILLQQLNQSITNLPSSQSFSDKIIKQMNDITYTLIDLHQFRYVTTIKV